MYEIQKDIPVPDGRRRGFTNVLRGMCSGESVEISQGKRPGAYAAAKLAGVKITIRATDKGTLRVWRTDGPGRPPDTADLDIFGQPFKKAAPAPVPALAPSPVVEPKPPTPRPKGSGYYQADRWSCKVWYEDLSKAPTATADTIFS